MAIKQNAGRTALAILVAVILAAFFFNPGNVMSLVQAKIAPPAPQLEVIQQINQLRYDYIVADPEYRKSLAVVLIRKIETLPADVVTQDLLDLVAVLSTKQQAK